MGRYIRWQAILALTGIAMTMAFLSFLSFSRKTIVIPDIGGTYSEGVVGTPQFINPLLAQFNQVDYDLSRLIFNGLARFNSQGELEPELAASWHVSPDGLTYQFTLRRDIRWQDGQPFTASDVLFTINLMQDPQFPGAPSLHQLWQSVSVEQVGDYSIRFTLPEPFPAFTEFTTIGILPAHLLGAMPAQDLLNHPFNLQPVGTGPFKLDEINAQFARLSTNPFYHGPKPRLNGLELRFYSNQQAVLSAYQAGNIQGIATVPPQMLPAVRQMESLNLYTTRLSGYNLIYLNLQAPEQAPFFQEAAVRKALLHGLNRQAIIDHALNGQAIIANGPILPWSWAYNPEQPTTDFDLALANQLLDESGWIDTDGDGIRDKDGQLLTFSLLSSDDPANIKVAETVRDQWLQLGVSTLIEVVGTGLDDRLAQRDFQAALAEVLLTGDPDPYPFWHQTQITGGQNYAGWDNTKASMLLEEARTITNRGQRNDAYFEFQRIFVEEVPSLILFHPVYTYGVSKDVLDVQITPVTNPSDRFRTITDWYLLTRRVINTDARLQEITR